MLITLGAMGIPRGVQDLHVLHFFLTSLRSAQYFWQSSYVLHFELHYGHRKPLLPLRYLPIQWIPILIVLLLVSQSACFKRWGFIIIRSCMSPFSVLTTPCFAILILSSKDHALSSRISLCGVLSYLLSILWCCFMPLLSFQPPIPTHAFLLVYHLPGVKPKR